ncbi:D-alanyl-D-alanine carboxypeptidase [Stappia sp. F7233]|uniref:serine-type D-Ala-D-Ala carboxypeptidase n=1 Tax=Stappia albiluteola TaxID=2758565 RepID=A0A839ABG2_9HYPH|nr:D-alanyl-D-alanine carboxypeptidase family protein [Stappia albiluteola]MBA5776761.1 D-alanyl-D-alanine carboxypeptidase [Stappia albiluteola]
MLLHRFHLVPVVAGILVLLTIGFARAAGETAAAKTSAYLLDMTTGTLLSAENPDRPFPPASTAKLMTAAVVFKALGDGEIRPDTSYQVSEHAWRTGGAPSRTTTMFAALNSFVSVDDLLRGLIIQNANDGAIVLAEGLSGSEAQFAERMNALAKEIGMTQSRFANPTGYDAEGAQTTARDLATLANYVVKEFPQRYPLFSQADFTWNNIFQRNRNPILGAIRDLDGIVAGYSEADGFNAIGSMLRGERRFLAVVAGYPTHQARVAALEKLFDSVDKDFEEVRLFEAREIVAEARTYGGSESRVGLVAGKPVDVLLPRGDRHAFRLRAVYRGPLVAPVAKGTVVGELRILHEDSVTYTVPLVTAENVGAGTMQSRAFDTVAETLFGWW